MANSAQALSALNGNPQLNAALVQAESCERLRAVRTPGGALPSAGSTVPTS